MIYIYHQSPLLANGLLYSLRQSAHFADATLECIRNWQDVISQITAAQMVICGKPATENEDIIRHFKELRTANQEVYILYVVNWVDPKFIKKLFSLQLIDGVVNQASEVAYFIHAVREVLDHQVFIDETIDLKKSQQENWEKTLAPQEQMLINSLTLREKEIMHLVVQGKSSTEISEQLFLSPFTVKTHRKNILHKLGAGNTFELINFLQSINYSQLNLTSE
jgi:DNA-binding NarL/FixJ family response regulator